MSKLLATVGLTLVLASTVAAAAPTAKSTDQAPVDKQYCLKFADDTGSHLTRTECHTKKEWKRLGVDLDELSTNDGGRAGLA